MNDSEYEALEAQWTPLLRKFARWAIPGMDSEDIMQELRIVLLKCQRKYDADETKQTKFITLLYGSCLNIMLNLLRDRGMGLKPYLKYVPEWAISSICEGEHGGVRCDNLRCTASQMRGDEPKVQNLNDPIILSLLEHASNDARWLAGLILRDKWSIPEVKKRIGKERVEKGIKELKVMLKTGGLS